MIPVALADDDLDDPIVWQTGTFDPDTGEVHIFILRASVERRLVDRFGPAWLAQYLEEQRQAIARMGVH